MASFQKDLESAKGGTEALDSIKIIDPDCDAQSDSNIKHATHSRHKEEKEANTDKTDQEGTEDPALQQAVPSNKPKKKKKSKKCPVSENQADGDTENADQLGDIDCILQKIETSSGLTTISSGSTKSRPLLYIEHRNLNLETELKNILALVGDQRRFFLALYKHMFFLEKRGCPCTALEFCKLILSLDPENDPLGMLLVIDFLSLRAREYTFLSRMFQEWEPALCLDLVDNTLYVGRCCSLWKEPMVMSWLEQNMRAVLHLVDNKETIVQEYEMRTHRPSNEGNLFFRSLLPNFNLQVEDLQEGDEAGAARDLNQGVNRLMAAMRDMLANIQFQEPPREDNPDEEADAEWD